jgi:hypothetical protein
MREIASRGLTCFSSPPPGSQCTLGSSFRPPLNIDDHHPTVESQLTLLHLLGRVYTLHAEYATFVTYSGWISRCPGDYTALVFAKAHSVDFTDVRAP